MLLTEQAARLHDGDWAPFFAAECAKPYFAALDAFVTEAAHTTVYPAAENIFAAFATCPAAGIRAVILGQDPYHEPGQAHGLTAGGTLEIVILFVGLEHLPPPEPPEDGPEQGDKTGIFHLPLLLIFGEQPDEEVDQNHGGWEEQGEIKPPQRRQDQKENQPEQAVNVKARVPLPKCFCGLRQGIIPLCR